MNNIINTIFEVFTAIMNWFVTAVSSVTAIFYGESGLTFIGAMTLCSLGVGIVLLLVNIVKNYVQFR